MQKHTPSQGLRVKFCLLVLGITLFVAGCGTGSSPGSPQPKPPNNGYSIISSVGETITLLQQVLHLNT